MRVAHQLCVGAMALAAAACGGDHSTSPGNSTHIVAGVAHLIHGPSPASTGSANARSRVARQANAAVPANGHWAISPDQGKVTIVSLTFNDPTGTNVQQVNLSNCVATYTRASQALSSILDCPFQVAAGTYVSLTVGFSTTFQVLINDAVNGFFSDPGSSSGISTTLPAGGAQFSSFTVSDSGAAGGFTTAETFFTSPLVVDSAAPPTVSLVVDMIHTVFVNVAGGVATFETNQAPAAVQLVPSLSGAARVAFYSSTGTALNVLMPGPTDDESRSVRVFWAASSQPSYLFSPVPQYPSQAWNTSPSVSPGGASGLRAGGYLGVDGSGNLCWAVPTNNTYTQYAQLRRMPVVATVGASTTLSIHYTSTVPAPTSGNTYASGCPTFTPDITITVFLVAN